MNDSSVEKPQASEGSAGSSATSAFWAKGFIDSCVMDGLSPVQPIIDPNASVIAWGSGFSSMLRAREFARHAKVASPQRLGTDLPVFGPAPMAVGTAFAALNWILRNRGESPVGQGEETDRIRRRLKRVVQQSRLVALTFGTKEPGRSLSAANVYGDLRQIFLLLRRFSPAAALLVAVDPAPIAGLALPANTAVKSALRAGVEEFLVAEAKEVNQTLFYFPVYELTQDFPQIPAPSRPILDIFTAYYASSGPAKGHAEQTYFASRLKTIATARRTAGVTPSPDSKPSAGPAATIGTVP